MIRNVYRSVAPFLFCALLIAASSGCQSVGSALSDPALRACGGQTALGLVAGGIIGKTVGESTGSATAGLIIGAAAGGTLGYTTCRQAWRHAQRLEEKYEALQQQLAAEQAAAQSTSAEIATTEEHMGSQTGVEGGDPGDEYLAEVPQIEVVENTAVRFDLPLHFETGSNQLKQRSLPHLDVLAESLQEFPSSRLTLIGHTDSMGNETENLQLSRARADAVAQYIASRGFGREYIEIIGKGAGEPAASNSTEDGRARNRRVEIIIIPTESTS